MNKETWLVILGAIVALTPFLGIPGTWKTTVYVVVGVLIMIITFLIRLRQIAHNRNSDALNGKKTDIYVENGMRVPGNLPGHDESKTQKGIS